MILRDAGAITPILPREQHSIVPMPSSQADNQPQRRGVLGADRRRVGFQMDGVCVGAGRAAGAHLQQETLPKSGLPRGVRVFAHYPTAM